MTILKYLSPHFQSPVFGTFLQHIFSLGRRAKCFIWLSVGICLNRVFILCSINIDPKVDVSTFQTKIKPFELCEEQNKKEVETATTTRKHMKKGKEISNERTFKGRKVGRIE